MDEYRAPDVTGDSFPSRGVGPRNAYSALMDAPRDGKAGLDPLEAELDADLSVSEIHIQIGQLWREIRRGAAATRLSDYIYREGPDGMDIGLIRVIEACVALGPCRVVDLAGFMDVTPSTASRAIARLEGMGFIERRAVDGDKRAVEVEVTAAGRARHEIFNRRTQFALQGILADFDDEDLHAMAGHFQALVERIETFLEEHEGQRLPDS